MKTSQKMYDKFDLVFSKTKKFTVICSNILCTHMYERICTRESFEIVNYTTKYCHAKCTSAVISVVSIKEEIKGNHRTFLAVDQSTKKRREKYHFTEPLNSKVIMV